jgi:hypothetical protein
MGDPHYMVLLNNEPIVDVGRPSQSYPVFPLFVKRNDAVGYMAAMSIPHPDCGLWTGTMEEAVAFCGGDGFPQYPMFLCNPPHAGHPIGATWDSAKCMQVSFNLLSTALLGSALTHYGRRPVPGDPLFRKLLRKMTPDAFRDTDIDDMMEDLGGLLAYKEPSNWKPGTFGLGG